MSVSALRQSLPEHFAITQASNMVQSDHLLHDVPAVCADGPAERTVFFAHVRPRPGFEEAKDDLPLVPPRGEVEGIDVRVEDRPVRACRHWRHVVTCLAVVHPPVEQLRHQAPQIRLRREDDGGTAPRVFLGTGPFWDWNCDGEVELWRDTVYLCHAPDEDNCDAIPGWASSNAVPGCGLPGDWRDHCHWHDDDIVPWSTTWTCRGSDDTIVMRQLCK